MHKKTLILTPLILLAACGNSTPTTNSDSLTKGDLVQVCHKTYDSVVNTLTTPQKEVRSISFEGHGLTRGTLEYQIAAVDAAANACYINFLGNLYSYDDVPYTTEAISFNLDAADMAGGAAMELNLLPVFDVEHSIFKLDIFLKVPQYSMTTFLSFLMQYDYQEGNLNSYRSIVHDSISGRTICESVDSAGLFSLDSTRETLSQDVYEEIDSLKDAFEAKLATKVSVNRDINSDLNELDKLSRQVSDVVRANNPIED